MPFTIAPKRRGRKKLKRVQEALQPMDVEANPLGHPDPAPSSSTALKRRGPNKLKRVQEATRPLNVEANPLGQPCNDEECPLARFIGLLVRDPNLLPITVKDWRKVPMEWKTMLFETVRAKFNIEGPKVKKWVLTKMGTLWRGWRNELKDTFFYPEMPLHKQYELHDYPVDLTQWRHYVDYLHTSKAKVCM
ncbi:hypothetical protein HHK36_027130 [Tetracentron sinense]|uniref:Uncharacterized protein n=1 Tax=Tetracentron sinense TaxID=13715 RepID=A0A835D2R6_TETSI|nr:hypothetical protein HHK36_027130 [Tetracentron sinense]